MYQENTLKAMKEGIKRGADYLEIDILYTKDNKIVIYHDTCFKETLPLCGAVKDYTLEELRERIDINTLEEVLTWGRENNVFFGLELKEIPVTMYEKSRQMLPSLISCIKEHDMLDQVFVFGANYKVLKELKVLEKQITIGIIVPFVPLDPVTMMKEMDALIYLSYVNNLTPEIVNNLKQNGYYIDGSTVKTKQTMELAISLGVDMVEVDDPDQWKDVLDKKENRKVGV
ncbi:glycerophosphoryl diester phosphodiesterase [Lachnoclostridium phytofermentans ISDg]|uniref:Glycerophosphoryl diester phosphodiesterase n=2 Tax=Lachnoclostridium phytofermentans TaxID=66219 RepID=A9KPS8_LACP7|nr:glycerophosphoryl diester phosphodiesterase [Lachnoclostridium phytofermentans ISDg]